jgi:hypothetical protein
MADKGPYGKVRGGKMKEGTPELCRPGTMPGGNSELNRGSGMPPSNPELCRPGIMPNTMPELDRGKGVGAYGASLVDRTAQNERARETPYDVATGPVSDTNLIPGHKRMAGMP